MMSREWRQAPHPEAEVMALYAGGDLPMLPRLQVQHHLSRCPRCSHEAARFRRVCEQVRLRAEDETLAGLGPVSNWARLEREMAGNINVGVAAARAIDRIGTKRPHRWGLTTLVATLALLFITGWFVNIPPGDSERLAESLRRLAGLHAPGNTGTVVETTALGVAVRSPSGALTLLHPDAAGVTVSLSGASAVDARYLDEDTGLVTITTVYGNGSQVQ